MLQEIQRRYWGKEGWARKSPSGRIGQFLVQYLWYEQNIRPNTRCKYSELFYIQGQSWWAEPSPWQDKRMQRGVSIPLKTCSRWLWPCQVEKFVAKVKAEKERARKALEMEARREQGAVSSNFLFRPLSFTPDLLTQEGAGVGLRLFINDAITVLFNTLYVWF